jgi:ABC-type transport system involved in multi-copper enzyme maturation permease subunit
MTSLSVVWSVARYEMLLLARSWAFRVFSVLALAVAVLVTAAVALPRDATFFFNRALAGAFPLLALKLFNVFLGLIAVFLATEFLKRDRRHDTSQVVFTHSFSNAAYILGKFLGIFLLLFLLLFLVLVLIGVIHVFFSRTPFAWEPYLLYIAVVTLPTVLFMVGLSVLLGSFLRSQPVVYLIALAYAFFALVVLGSRADAAFDSFAYFTPVIRSDFIGLGNPGDLVRLRGAYASLGLAMILGATLFMRRLKQSSFMNRAAIFLAVGLGVLGSALLLTYLGDKQADRTFRARLKAESVGAAEVPAASLAACDIRIAPSGSRLRGDADLTLVNRTPASLDRLLLTLNPGLKVERITGPAGTLAFEQTDHLVTVRPAESLAPDAELRLTMAYAGTIDERYCYLDIDDERYWSPLRFWLVTVPKRYAAVGESFIHLTPECGWYPRPGLSPALLFPKAAKGDFSRYTLTVTLPAELTAVSQGPVTESGGETMRTFVFKPEEPLPQISLTAGRYEKKAVDVDGTEYALYTLAGHDRFTPLLPELKTDLPAIIRQARIGYEALLGLDYPYKRFALVETPIQLTSYDRLWNTAQEQVQPEIVFLPEMAALCQGADFRSSQRQMLGPGMGRGSGGAPGAAAAGQARGGFAAGQRGGGGATGRGQAAAISPKDLQRALLNRFITSNLTERTVGRGVPFRAGLFGIRFETNSESKFGIFPLFTTYARQFAAAEWPLFGYVIEAYLRGRITIQAGPGLRLAQSTSVQEEIARILTDHSLAELLTDPESGRWPLSSILEAKSRELLALIQAALGEQSFDAKLTEWLKELSFRSCAAEEIRAFFAGLGTIDLSGLFSRWSEGRGLPGFVFDDLESYRVVEKEKQRAQLKFRVTNPTDTPGVIKVEYIVRGAAGGARMGGGGSLVTGRDSLLMGMAGSAERRFFVVPARTAKTVGLVMDQPAVATTIDTYISRNLPPSFLLPFLTTPAQPGATAFEGEVDRPSDESDSGVRGEVVVDDEDPGFTLPAGDRENWLRRFIRKTFPTSVDAESEYAQFRDVLNPPGQWTPVIMQNFYGRFVRTSYLKRSGNGQSRVTWTADLGEAGDYDLSFYHTPLLGGGGMMGGMRGGAAVGGRGSFGGGSPGQRGQAGIPQRGGAVGPGGRGGAPGFAARLQPGKKHFIVHSADGTEEVVVDLRDAAAGWNLIGTFRFAAGPNTIELTDRNESIYVMADAVRWLRRKDVP